MAPVDGWVQIAGALLTGGVGAAGVAALANRKKLGAQTVDQLAKTASDIADDARTDTKSAREERDSANRRANRVEVKNRAWWERADRHAVWDRKLIHLAREAGIEIEDPPDLYPNE